MPPTTSQSSSTTTAPTSARPLRGERVAGLLWGVDVSVTEAKYLGDRESAKEAPVADRTVLHAEVLGRLRACGAAMQSLAAQFAAQAAVHPTDLHALEHLSRRTDSPPTVGELGLLLDLSSAAVTGLVDRLERGGLVERFPDPGDGRRVRVRMTPQAHALAGQVFGTYGARMRDAMASFSAEELRTVSAFLDAATAAAETRPDVP
jgi:DNA-binding MarR family transcriptional regulator